MSARVVGEWLRTLNLDGYTDAFLENGYDDLEICRQIGEADLDAIGVSEPAHRSKIIAAVSRLAERTAGAALYFDLEEELQPERAAVLTIHHHQQQQQLLYHHHHSHNNHYHHHHHLQNHHQQQQHYGHHQQQQQHLNVYQSQGARSSYSKLRLKVLLREKLLRDGITLGAPPYSSAGDPRGCLEELARSYAEYFHVHSADVAQRLEELRARSLARDSELEEGPRGCCEQGVDVYRTQMEESLGFRSAASTPEMERKCGLQKFASQEESAEAKSEVKKKGKSFWQTLQRTPNRTPNRTPTRTPSKSPRNKPARLDSPHKACGAVNFVASDITMSDDDRIELMTMVKDRRMTIDQALARLEEYETLHRQCGGAEGARRRQSLDAACPLPRDSPCHASGACECMVGGPAVTAAERFVRLHKATVAAGGTPHGAPHRQLVKVEEGTRGVSSTSCYTDVYAWECRLRTPGLPSALPEYEEPPQQAAFATPASSSCRLDQPASLLPSSPHVRSLCSTPEIRRGRDPRRPLATSLDAHYAQKDPGSARGDRHRAGRLCGGASGVLESPGHVASQAREPSAEPSQGTFVVSLEEIHEARRRMHLRRLLCSSYEPAAACELRNGLVATGVLRDPGLEECKGEKEEGDEVEEEEGEEVSKWRRRRQRQQQQRTGDEDEADCVFFENGHAACGAGTVPASRGRGLCRDSGIGSCGPDFGSGGAEGAAIRSGNPELEYGGGGGCGDDDGDDGNGGAPVGGRIRGGGDENGLGLEAEEEAAWIWSRPIGAGDGDIGRESAFRRSGGGRFEGGAGVGAGCRACAGHAAPLHGSPGKVHLNGCAAGGGGGGSVVEADPAVLHVDVGSPGRAAVERRERKGLLCRLQRKTRTSSFNGFDLPSRQGALGERPSLPVKHEEDADPSGESPYRRASAPDSFLGKKVKSVRDTMKKTMTKLAKANCEERESDFDVALRCTRLSLEEEQLVEEKPQCNNHNNGHHHHQQQQRQLAEEGGEVDEGAGGRHENLASCLNGARLREFHRCAARGPPSSSCRRAPEGGGAGGSCGTGERLAATGASRSPGGAAATPPVAPVSPRDRRKAGAHATEVRAIVHRENHATEPPSVPGLAADTGAGAETAPGPSADGDRSSSAAAAAAGEDAESKGSSRRKKTKPKTVLELLERIHLQDYAGLLTRSGYEDLETLGLLDAEDLDEMGVLDHEHRAKLLTAAALLRADERDNHGRQRNASFDQDAAHRGTSALATAWHRSPGRSAEDPRRRAGVRCLSDGSRRGPAPAAAWGCGGAETRGPARRSWSLDDVRKIEHLLEFGRWQRRLARRATAPSRDPQGVWWSPGHRRHHHRHRHRHRRDEQRDLGACGEDVAARQTAADAAAIEPTDAVTSTAATPGAASSDGPGAKAAAGAAGAAGAAVDPAGGDPNGEAVAEPPAAGATSREADDAATDEEEKAVRHRRSTTTAEAVEVVNLAERADRRGDADGPAMSRGPPGADSERAAGGGTESVDGVGGRHHHDLRDLHHHRHARPNSSHGDGGWATDGSAWPPAPNDLAAILLQREPEGEVVGAERCAEKRGCGSVPVSLVLRFSQELGVQSRAVAASLDDLHLGWHKRLAHAQILRSDQSVSSVYINGLSDDIVDQLTLGEVKDSGRDDRPLLPTVKGPFERHSGASAVHPRR
ncbi:uncharacterized protein LOC116955640 isoform X2 [Petromyzon marinus]|uniref:uncharacterized protein LOC116955640 isoform X1 n=1 Tax=Petromyzon marinus TaxID=7757 RepID=UPI003F71C574